MSVLHTLGKRCSLDLISITLTKRFFLQSKKACMGTLLVLPDRMTHENNGCPPLVRTVYGLAKKKLDDGRIVKYDSSLTHKNPATLSSSLRPERHFLFPMCSLETTLDVKQKSLIQSLLI